MVLSTVSLRRRHNGYDSVSNHQPRECLLRRLIRRTSKKTSKLRVTGLCAGNSPETGEFPAQMASNAENVSIWWRHHVCILTGNKIPNTTYLDYIHNSEIVAFVESFPDAHVTIILRYLIQSKFKWTWNVCNAHLYFMEFNELNGNFVNLHWLCNRNFIMIQYHF